MKISIEAGHLYNSQPLYTGGGKDFVVRMGDKIMHEQAVKELGLAKTIDDTLSETPDTNISRTFFHDDIIGQIDSNKSLHDSRRHQMFLARPVAQVLEVLEMQGVKSDNITTISEYRLIDSGRQKMPTIIKQAKENGRAYDRKEKTITKNEHTIKLWGYKEFNNIPSCEVLDSMQYIRTLSNNDIAINLLPLSQMGQQQRTRKILELIQPQPNVIVLYHKDGTVIQIEGRSKSDATKETLKRLKAMFSL